MKKILILLSMILIPAAAPSLSRGDFIYSTSGTNALAGSTLNLTQGDSSSLYVWVSTNPGQTLTGISFNVLSSSAPVVSATGHFVENPATGATTTRWTSITVGGLNTSGNLVNNHRAFYLPGLTNGTGISTSGPADFVLYSTINFNATAIGSTELSFTATTAGVSQLGGGGNIWNSIPKGTATINVSAIPEPGSAALLALAGLAIAFRRRK